MNEEELRFQCLRLAMEWASFATNAGNVISKAEEFIAFVKGDSK